MTRVSIGEVCDFAYGDSLPEAHRKAGSVPVFGSNGVVGFHDRAITGGPTIIIGRKGSIGEVRWSDGPCFPIDTTYYIERTKVPCDLRWLYHALKHIDLTRLNKSAAVPGLNRDDAYDQEICFPPLPEQRRIAAQLEQADRLRRTRRFTLDLSDTFLPATFRRMFGDAFANGPFDRFGDLVKITGGGTPARENPEYFTGNIPWFTSKDMRDDYIWDTEEHITKEAIQQSATKLVPAGSVLLVVKSKVLMHRLPVAISKVALCHGQDIKSIQCAASLDAEFARHTLRFHAPRLLRLARGANTEGLTLPMIEELPVPKICIPQQARFAAIVAQHECLSTTQRESLRQAEHLFQTLLHRAFSA